MLLGLFTLGKDMISEKIKQEMMSGELYQADVPELLDDIHRCEQECWEINHMPPSQRDERDRRIARLFGKAGKGLHVIAPMQCDYGYNIEVGDCFFANFNLTILDENKVTFGDHVFIGPNCSFYTAGHPLDVEQRNRNLEYSRPIHVGNNVWFGGNVTVVPGVNIGNDCVIAAGAVVTRDIPDGSLAAGVPARVIRQING